MGDIFNVSALIDRDVVLGRIHLWLSYYAGKRMPDVAEFDRVSSLPVDEELISGFISTHIAELNLKYASGSGYSDTALSGVQEGVSVPLPNSFQDSARVEIMTSYVVKMCLHDWCFTVGESEAASDLLAEAEALSSALDSSITDNRNRIARSRILPLI